MTGQTRFDGMGLGTRLRLLLAALDGELQAVYDAAGEPFRPRFYPVAQLLRAQGSGTVGDLAVRTGVSQPAMTQTLAEMRARGLVATDAPGRRVMLTAEGEALCARLAPVWRAVEAAAVELDRELPASLGATVAAALARLAERPFGERIRSALEEQ
jgi:DNA-binding MarR family transcriptional regulator